LTTPAIPLVPCALAMEGAKHTPAAPIRIRNASAGFLADATAIVVGLIT
jgi:hypothetical protein